MGVRCRFRPLDVERPFGSSRDRRAEEGASDVHAIYIYTAAVFARGAGCADGEARLPAHESARGPGNAAARAALARQRTGGAGGNARGHPRPVAAFGPRRSWIGKTLGGSSDVAAIAIPTAYLAWAPARRRGRLTARDAAGAWPTHARAAIGCGRAALAFDAASARSGASLGAIARREADVRATLGSVEADVADLTNAVLLVVHLARRERRAPPHGSA